MESLMNMQKKKKPNRTLLETIESTLWTMQTAQSLRFVWLHLTQFDELTISTSKRQFVENCCPINEIENELEFWANFGNSSLCRRSLIFFFLDTKSLDPFTIHKSK